MRREGQEGRRGQAALLCFIPGGHGRWPFLPTEFGHAAPGPWLEAGPDAQDLRRTGAGDQAVQGGPATSTAVKPEGEVTSFWAGHLPAEVTAQVQSRKGLNLARFLGPALCLLLLAASGTGRPLRFQPACCVALGRSSTALSLRFHGPGMGGEGSPSRDGHEDGRSRVQCLQLWPVPSTPVHREGVPS